MLVNMGRVDALGVDARVTVLPYRRIRGGASVSLIDADSPELGEDPIDRMAERRGDLWIEARGRRVRSFLRARYVGETVDQGVTLPVYALVDASGYFHLNDQLSASLRLDNLLDERYIGGVIVNDGNGRFYAPAPTSTLLVSATAGYQF